MKRIGVLIDSTTCSKYLFETVSKLSNSNQVELFFLLSNSAMEQQNVWGRIRRKIKSRKLIGTISAVFFKFVTYTESVILSILFQDIREHNIRMSLDEFITNDPVNLNPIASKTGLVVRYADQDIESVESLDLDLIVRGNVEGAFTGGILGASRKGIISLKYGDNRWNRGSPPAFWEVYFRKPSTGFVIELMTEELDGRSVIFRGDCVTYRSYVENITQLHLESNPYLAKLILDYAASNHFPAPEEPLPYGEPILVMPTFWQTMIYLMKTGTVFVSRIVNQKVLRKHERWSVAFSPGPWRQASLSKGIQIENTPNHFFADPFVVKSDDRTICYVEDYDHEKERGCVTAIELMDDTSYRVLGPVIEEPYHMSFPFILEYDNDLYMIPETSQSKAIRLYKCVQFPMEWVYQKDILSNVSAVDSMMFEYDGRWWLLTNMTLNENGVHKPQLFAYYSSHPLSDEWMPHERNPLIFDSEIGRNGGILDLAGNSPVRVRQKQDFDSYGSSLTLAEIVDLTTTTYREQKIGQILPNFIPGIKGCHHLHSNGEYTVYDYLRTETIK